MTAEQNKTHRFVHEAEAEVEEVLGRNHLWYCRPDLVDTDKLNFVRAQFPPGGFHDFHDHPRMEEILYVLSGTAEQWVEGERRILTTGDVVHIPEGIAHATFTAGEDTLEFLAVLSPADSGEPMTVDRSGEEPWCSLRS